MIRSGRYINVIAKVLERDVCSLKRIYFLPLNLGHRWKHVASENGNYEVAAKCKQQPVRSACHGLCRRLCACRRVNRRRTVGAVVAHRPSEPQAEAGASGGGQSTYAGSRTCRLPAGQQAPAENPRGRGWLEMEQLSHVLGR